MVVQKFNNTSNNKLAGRPKYGAGDSEQQKTKYQSAYAKYMNQGREAAAQGDSVEAERFFQHAEHYIRMINWHSLNTKKMTNPVSKEQPVGEATSAPQNAEKGKADTSQEPMSYPMDALAKETDPKEKEQHSNEKTKKRKISRAESPAEEEHH